MQKILLVCFDKKWIAPLRFILETFIPAEVDVPANGPDALNLYRQKHHQLDVVVYYPGEDDFILEDLFAWKSKDHGGPHLLVLCSPQFHPAAPTGVPGQKIHFLDRSQAVSELEKWFNDRKLLGPSVPYRSVCIDCLTLFDGAREDLYLKMGDGKYLKLFREGDELSDQDLLKYQQKGVSHLYLTPAALAAMMAQLKAQFSLFLKNKNFKVVVRDPASSKQARFEQKIIRAGERLLVTEEFKALVESKVKKSVDQIKKNPKLGKFLSKISLSDAKGAYLPSHILHLSTLSCALAKLVDWNSDITLEKLVYASLLHDVMLFSHPHLAEIHTLENFEQKRGALSQEEAHAFLEHPAEAAKLVAGSFNLAPPETETIILQHHERPDGTGFPKRINAIRITPLSALFILAHDMVVFFMENPDALLSHYVLRAEKYLNQGSFKPVVKALKEALEGGPQGA